jgi:hypothetical protein
LPSGGSVEFLHKRHIHQVEKIQQADPGDAGQKVNPAHQHQEIGIEVGRKVDLRTTDLHNVDLRTNDLQNKERCQNRACHRAS